MSTAIDNGSPNHDRVGLSSADDCQIDRVEWSDVARQHGTPQWWWVMHCTTSTFLTNYLNTTADVRRHFLKLIFILFDVQYTFLQYFVDYRFIQRFYDNNLGDSVIMKYRVVLSMYVVRLKVGRSSQRLSVFFRCCSPERSCPKESWQVGPKISMYRKRPLHILSLYLEFRYCYFNFM